MRAARVLVLLATIQASAMAARPAAAEPAEPGEPIRTAASKPAPAEPGEPTRTAASKPAHPEGRPTVKLDRLEFPDDVPNARYFKQHLRRALRHEAYRADWGAGRGATIEYRFYVRELSLVTRDGVLHVICTAYGKLPSGRTAKSHLDFGGAPSRRNQVVRRVLEIISRGVITRLAEMERVRRGDLRRRRRIRTPSHDPD